MPQDENDIFARFFYFVSRNGYTKVTYPEAWDKKEQRETIIEMEKKHQAAHKHSRGRGKK
jgi:hypothetical protein